MDSTGLLGETLFDGPTYPGHWWMVFEDGHKIIVNVVLYTTCGIFDFQRFGSANRYTNESLGKAPYRGKQIKWRPVSYP